MFLLINIKLHILNFNINQFTMIKKIKTRVLLELVFFQTVLKF